MTFTVVGLGEVLWDLLPGGPQLGGAPTNFACQARALGAHAMIVTRIGDDELGRKVIERFTQLNLSRETVQIDLVRSTGTVAVRVEDGGVPHYTFAENAAWEHLSVTNAALQSIRGAHAVCFGTLGQRRTTSRETIQTLVAAAPAESLKIFDINLRLDLYTREIIEESMRLSNVLKMNDDELTTLTAMFALRGDVRQRVEYLARKFGFKVIVVTRGSLSSLIHQEGRWSELPSQSVEVRDTVGAGDAFTAALTMGLLTRMNLDDAHLMAAEVARYVCSQDGATPPLPEKFRKPFE